MKYNYITSMRVGGFPCFYFAILGDIENAMTPLNWIAGLTAEECGQMMGGN